MSRNLLTPDAYGDIHQAMVEPLHNRPTAAIAMDAEFVRTEEKNSFVVWERHDYSLSRQLGQLITTPESINPMATEPPDTFLFTEFSAVPVADAVRGFYDAAGLQQPRIGTIEANRNLSTNMLFGPTSTLGPRTTAEADRLARIFDGSEHVVVVDQLVASGRTMRLAARLLHTAGVEIVSGIRGYWYDQAHQNDLQAVPVTSIHSDFMRQVGKDAYDEACLINLAQTEQYTNIPTYV